jgi:SAM-dependent methyltransferase
VTDIDPRWMGAGTASNIELRRHDIVDDELDEGRFDLVHARLVLPHLPERRRALAKMLAALKPGGWLLIDDFDCSWLPFVPQCHEAGDARLFLKVADAFHQVLQDGGVDIAHGRGFYPLLLAHGLANVEVDGRVQIWPGGSPGALLWQANIAQLTDKLLGRGLLSEEEILRFCRLVEDPDFSVNSYLLVSGVGQRPASSRFVGEPGIVGVSHETLVQDRMDGVPDEQSAPAATASATAQAARRRSARRWSRRDRRRSSR